MVVRGQKFWCHTNCTNGCNVVVSTSSELSWSALHVKEPTATLLTQNSPDTDSHTFHPPSKAVTTTTKPIATFCQSELR